MGFTWIEKGIESIDGFLTYLEYECDAEVNERKYYKRQTAALWTSSAICGGLHFHRQSGRPDNGNYLKSGEIRGNMRVVKTFHITVNTFCVMIMA